MKLAAGRREESSQHLEWAPLHLLTLVGLQGEKQNKMSNVVPRWTMTFQDDMISGYLSLPTKKNFFNVPTAVHLFCGHESGSQVCQYLLCWLLPFARC